MNTQEHHNEEIPQTDNLFSPLSDDQTMGIDSGVKASSENVIKPDISQDEIDSNIKDGTDIELINKEIENLNFSISTMNDAIRMINDVIAKENNDLERELEEYTKGFNEASLLAEYEPEKLEAIRDTLGSNEYNEGFKAAKEYHSKEREQSQANSLSEIEAIRTKGQWKDNDLANTLF